MNSIKHLLPPVEKYFKANLHTHTNISDGKLSPKDVKELYKAQGYSILALTDHSVTVDHQNLCDEDFLLLTGVEVDIEEGYFYKGDRRYLGKSRHFCLISKDPHKLWIPFRDPDMLPQAEPYFHLCHCENMERLYTQESFNAIIAKSNEQGYLVSYNHPVWSLENFSDYATMKGLWGVEYRNSCSVGLGFDENNGQVYQDFLTLGNPMMPVMADDMHRSVTQNGFPVLGNSWNMIGAEKLEYDAVISAMIRGDLYGSCGPDIHSLTWDGKNVHISCSPARQIQLVTQSRWAQTVYCQDGLLDKAEFDMSQWLQRSEGDMDSFFRLIVTACNGTYAVTRAYFLSEL